MDKNNAVIIEKLDQCIDEFNEKREIDKRIIEIQNTLKNGNREEINKAFNEVYYDFQYFIMKQISNLYLVGFDKEDLIQEAALHFYKAIMRYDAKKGGFINFAKLCIKGNICTKMNKALKPQKKGISITYIDEYNNDAEKNNYDDYIYYNYLGEDNPIFKHIIENEQCEKIISAASNILTRKEKDVLFLYLQGKSYKEISKMYHIKYKSVDNALYRARDKIESLKSTIFE